LILDELEVIFLAFIYYISVNSEGIEGNLSNFHFKRILKFLITWHGGYQLKQTRVLVFSASFGAGHVKAAEALIETIKNIKPSAEIIHRDSIAMLNKNLNYFLCKLYITLMKRAPKIWGVFYNQTQELPEDSLFQRFLNSFGRNTLVKYLNMLKPDVIVCTYPTVAGVLARLRAKGELDIPVAAVVTDYTVHNQWIHRGVDLYIVGSAKVSKGFIERGIEPSRIQTSGIPVNSRFESNLNQEDILTNLEFSQNRLTFLIMCGASGVLEKAKWICNLIAKIEAPVQAIIVCGNDRKLYSSLEDVVKEARNPIVRFSFVHNVDELMSAADIIITKAGGLIVSEALTKHIPMIIFKPIPGQEENNARFINEIGAGRIAFSEEQFVDILYELIDSPSEIKKMIEASIQAFPGRSAEKAAQVILELADGYSDRTSNNEQAVFTLSGRFSARACLNALYRISRPFLPMLKRSLSFFFTE
jgi:processive 1,2-diacylglycerol beta-glucosyltransferase